MAWRESDRALWAYEGSKLSGKKICLLFHAETLNYLMPLNYQATDLKQVKENNNCKLYNFIMAFISNQNGLRND